MLYYPLYCKALIQRVSSHKLSLLTFSQSSSDMSGDLKAIVNRLEAVTSRLEGLAAKGGSGSGGGGGADGKSDSHL